MKASPPRRRRDGFTLLELLAVITVIAVLAILMLSMVDHHPHRSKAILCLNNVRQLSIGWLTYAGGKDDRLMYNCPPDTTVDPTNDWIAGVIDWSGAPQNTNAAAIPQGQLFRYLPKTSASPLLHCPADPSVVGRRPRARSYSMNAFVGNNGAEPVAAGWKQFLKLSDLTHPSATFVFIDEHPNSIDDGCFVSDPARTNAWIDLVASSHNGAGSFSFADGHAEIHKWRDPATRQPFVPNGPKPHVAIPAGESGLDLAWFLRGATEKTGE